MDNKGEYFLDDVVVDVGPFFFVDVERDDLAIDERYGEGSAATLQQMYAQSSCLLFFLRHGVLTEPSRVARYHEDSLSLFLEKPHQFIRGCFTVSK